MRDVAEPMTRPNAWAGSAALVLFLLAPLAVAKPGDKVPPLKLQKDGPHHVTVEIPAGVYCGVDGAPLKEAKEPIKVFTTRQHTIKCSTLPNGRNASDTVVPGDFLGKLTARATVAPAKDAPKGRMALTLTDAAGAPIDDAQPTIKSPDGATFGPVTPGDGGTYGADISWTAGKKTIKLHVEVPGADPIEDTEVHLDGSAAAPPPDKTPPPPPKGGDTTQEPTAPQGPPPKERWLKIDAGVFGGIGIGANGVGPNFGLEGGVSHGFKSIGLGAMFRFGYEKYSSGGKDEQIIQLALPVSLRILVSPAWFPYASVIPSLNFSGIVFQGLPGRDVALGLGLGGGAGAQFKVGPLGLFAEGDVRFGRSDHGAIKVKLPIVSVLAGARVSL
jgi:hypothetical protein